MQQHVSQTKSESSVQLGTNHLTVRDSYRAWNNVFKNIGRIYKKQKKTKNFRDIQALLTKVLFGEFLSRKYNEKIQAQDDDGKGVIDQEKDSEDLFKIALERMESELDFNLQEKDYKKLQRIVNEAVSIVGNVLMIKPEGKFEFWENGSLYDEKFHEQKNSRDDLEEIDENSEAYVINTCMAPSYSSRKSVFEKAQVFVEKINLKPEEKKMKLIEHGINLLRKNLIENEDFETYEDELLSLSEKENEKEVNYVGFGFDFNDERLVTIKYKKEEKGIYLNNEFIEFNSIDSFSNEENEEDSVNEFTLILKGKERMIIFRKKLFAEKLEKLINGKGEEINTSMEKKIEEKDDEVEKKKDEVKVKEDEKKDDEVKKKKDEETQEKKEEKNEIKETPKKSNLKTFVIAGISIAFFVYVIYKFK